MSKFKVVPMVPTAEMVEAAEEAYMPFGDMDLAIRMALLAAPAVQGEPVGWVWHSYNQTNFTSGSHHKEVLEADGVKLTPVYTAPQPAEQQPISHDWDDQDKCRRCGDRDWYASATCTPKPQPELAKYRPCGRVICTCDHETQCQGCGGHHCGTHPVGQFTAPAYLRPAPDVTGPINVSYTDGNGAVRSSPADCRHGVRYVTVSDTVYWPLSAEDAQRLRSAEFGRGDFTGPVSTAAGCGGAGGGAGGRIASHRRPAMTTNRPKVQRYDNMGCPEEICRVDTMYESDDGYYAVYEDYEALQAECDKLRALLRVREPQQQKLTD